MEGTLIFTQKLLDDPCARWCLIDASGNVVSRDDVIIEPEPKTIIKGERDWFPVDRDIVRVSLHDRYQDQGYFFVSLNFSNVPKVTHSYRVAHNSTRRIGGA